MSQYQEQGHGKLNYLLNFEWTVVTNGTNNMHPVKDSGR
jgi:hypothetical protein